MEILNKIDHTLLKPDATIEEVESLCKEALDYGFASVCVNPSYVRECKSILEGSDINIATVIGFPLGANTKNVKVFETMNAIKNGANEIDMVINIGAVKNKQFKIIKEEIEEVVNVCKEVAVVKVILETCLLNDDEKAEICKIAMNVGADYVKTSTGFSSGGATVEDIRLMKLIVSNKVGIKASGGIRDLTTAKQMLDAGATRLGTSSGVKIAKQL